MSVVLNLDILSILEQIAKAGDVISKTTNNVQAVGVTAELAEFVTAHAALGTAQTACEAAKTDCKAKTATRNAAHKVFKAKFKALAGAIEDVTGGEPEAVLSTGLDLKADPAPAQPLEAPTNLRAATNGTPGKTKLSADPLPGAVLFVVEQSVDPITADSWEEVAKVTKPSCTLEGAEPGKKCWFRMAAVNSLGQGPWTDPVARPVM